MRLIDADALKERFKPKEEYSCFKTDLFGLNKIIDEAPTVEVDIAIVGDYKERYKSEYRVLVTRINKLTDYIKKYRDDSIENYLKAQQLDAMIRYKNILELRAKIENIEI